MNAVTNRRQLASKVCRIRWMITGLLVLFNASDVSAQLTVGDWNLSSWAFNGKNISTPTVNSNGSTPVGLSAMVNSPVSFFLIGAADGLVSTAMPYSVPASAISNYSLSQSFQLSTPVDFGTPSSQSQFGDTNTDNGIGIQIKSESAIYITQYNLSLSLTGGGVITSMGGDYDGFGNLVGLGTNTVTLGWPAVSPVDGIATFDGIQISGPITGFSVTHDVTYSNNLFTPLFLTNIVEIKINTSELTAVLPGDFNDDDKVDAADFAIWRDKNGSNIALTNDGNLGPPIRAEHYNLWRTQFGVMATPGVGVAIPEPGTFVLAGIGFLAFAASRSG